ncbi:DEAD/DEAH box helicase family protein [Ligilactobacillus saerimneri]|uniref:DEAD/DEAH box helicase family protein n=1 Tax=Ligilactobacillus saerimneri TaxID=228229 RepID=UPI0024B19221|nr:DEAD/DEAH box helicase family protein [Ligilactobacillus saerimneri]MDI9205737.1 DEAD/DEAH box helicase family protein [Ligilactobacillus saerimneri]
MNTPKIKSFKQIIPMIYAYTTPNDSSHQGWTKIGYTESQSVEDRVKQQTHTADVKFKILWKGNARYQDGTDEAFTDHEFHEYLTTKKQIERKPKTEWFHVDGDTSHQYFYKFTERDFSDVQGQQGTNYELRQEQQQAVEQTMNYFLKNGAKSEFLWNAKPRFGKTLSTYDLIRRMKLQNVLVVTNRPSIANSWFDDFDKFIAWQTNYKFVSETDALKDRPVLSRNEFLNTIADGGNYGQITFESLQGLKGSVHFGGSHEKLKWIRDLEWDLLVIDEAHEGVDTYRTDKAFEKIKRKYTLHLTGTPFKALAKGKFAADQIYNWSYADEQKAKASWDETHEDGSNPYAVMPQLNMYTYQISAMMVDQLKAGIELDDGDKVNPAFDLNEFFRTRNGKFVYDDAVDRFLDALTTQEKYPFSTPELRQELAHTFWLLNRVNSAKALAKKLKHHPVFSEYQIVLAAGDGQLKDDQLNDKQLAKANEKSFDKVQKAIKNYDKTITLSVGQLTTGVTIKPWSGVLMLSSMKSPSEYMQAAFRAQNPYSYNHNGVLMRKQNAYVFDFDPTRTLIIFDEFANNLLAETANGKGTAADHEENIRKLLNFFPVIGEDEEGRMVELDAKQVMSIPRRLKSQEVVKRGFMSNFLFTNIDRVFGAPAAVREILKELVPTKEANPKKGNATLENVDDIAVNDQGKVDVPNERVIGKFKDLFGDKIYAETGQQVANDVKMMDKSDFAAASKKIVKQLNDQVNTEVINRVRQEYRLKKKEAERYQKQINKENEKKFNRIADEMNNQKKLAQTELKTQEQAVRTDEELAKVHQEYQAKIENILDDFNTQVNEEVQKTIKDTPTDVIKRVEHHREESKVKEVEDDVRAHLRGFSRTIPSFIMAYGDENLTLQNFDDYTEDDVFAEVTGISEEQFRFLRDGGDYFDEKTNTKKHFEGHLFDEVIFNDSIQQFLELRDKLSNYFDESSNEDIFDYIPPQKTNQIYTPRAVVKRMVDDLEANNPGIFADPNKTFADLYMKSGLYITEIVKRLFRNETMKKLYPNDRDRITHIMCHQVYGLAPTRIIYLIATNYIFGFDDDLRHSVLGKHFKQIDAAKYAKEGTLQDVIQKEFGGNYFN